jgi:hypothetical protein
VVTRNLLDRMCTPISPQGDLMPLVISLWVLFLFLRHKPMTAYSSPIVRFICVGRLFQIYDGCVLLNKIYLMERSGWRPF